MSGLTLKNISKSFGSLKVIDDLSLELADGELLVLLGPSGCGKSTLLRLIAGLESLDEGEIYVNSRRIDNLPPKKRELAMVFQNYSLYPHMTIEKNLGFPLKVAKVKKPEIRERVEKVAQMLGLSDKLKNRPAELSGGQRQRVALGRAVVREPSLFLLDEPLSNLDADLRARMRLEIVGLQKELKITTIHVTHDQAEALTMADRIGLLHEGKLQQLGTPEELYKDPNSLFTAQFIGQPQINIVDAKIERHLLIPFGLSLLNESLPHDLPRVLVGLRPEDIRIDQQGEFKATVAGCEYLGDHYILTLNFLDSELVVSGSEEALETGAVVRFTFDQNDLLYFDADNGQRID